LKVSFSPRHRPSLAAARPVVSHFLNRSDIGILIAIAIEIDLRAGALREQLEHRAI
jgi:hypothetical protein